MESTARSTADPMASSGDVSPVSDDTVRAEMQALRLLLRERRELIDRLEVVNATIDARLERVRELES